MVQIFISYSRTDEDFARRLAADLDSMGARIWIDVDSIPPGVNWSTAVQQGLDACDVLILIISPASMASSNVVDEWQYARDEHKPIIPILWQPAGRIHFQLRRIQHIDFHLQPYERALGQLRARLLDHDDTLGDLPSLAPDSDKTLNMRRITPRTARRLVSLRTIEGHRASVTCAAFSPDSTLIASGSEDKTVRLWYAGQRRRIKMMIGHEKPVNALAFSPSGLMLASASDDRTIRLWHVSKRYCIAALRGHTAPVTGVAFGPDDSLLASASEDGSIRLWNALKHTPVAVLEKQEDPVTALSFSPDGARLAAASGLSLRVWDVGGRSVLDAHDLPDEARCIAFSPDGALLAIGLADHGLLALSVHNPDERTGPALTLLSQIDYADYNARCVRGVAFAPNGGLLAMASLDGMLRLWKTDDLRQGKSPRALKALHGHEGGVTAAAFSADGTLLLSASHDGTLRLWNVER